MKPIVFDSWPIVAFFDNEPSALKVEEVINRSLENNREMLISVINLGEIWYNYKRIYSEEFADELIQKIHSINIQAVNIDWKLARIAANFKSGGGISYADCFCAALAKQMDASLITGDKEFKRIEKDLDIIWV